MTDAILTALVAAARDGDLARYAAALGGVPVQRLNTIGREDAFQRSVALLVPVARTGAAAEDRLKALALIGRADSTTQQKQPAIADAARLAVRDAPPPIGSDERVLSSDERYYLSLVIARAEAPWVVPYAARALVDEGGEARLKNDVRAAYAALVFERSATLADAYRAIEGAVSGSLHEDPGTKEADLSRARRLTKLLPAIEDSTRSTLTDSGDDLVPAFNAMMQRLVFRHARPPVGGDGDDAAGASAEAVLLLLSTLLRTRFVLAVEADAYLSVGRLKYWHKTETWPKAAAAARRRLSQTLLQAITLRAKTGNPSRELLAVLIQIAGDRRRAEPQLAAIAEQRGIVPDVQDWLRAGGRQTAPRFETRAGDEAGLRDVDALLGAAAVRAAHVRSLLDGDGKAALARIRDQAELADSARALTQAANFSRALASDVLALLQRRSLALFGAVGDEVEAERERHRREDGRLIDTATVRIERAGVERVLPNGVAEVILPAVVTPVEGKRK